MTEQPPFWRDVLHAAQPRRHHALAGVSATTFLTVLTETRRAGTGHDRQVGEKFRCREIADEAALELPLRRGSGIAKSRAPGVRMGSAVFLRQSFCGQ